MSQSAAAGPGSTHETAPAEHTSFIKTPQQLLVVLALSFLVPIIGILLLVYLVLGEHAADPATFEPRTVAARI